MSGKYAKRGFIIGCFAALCFWIVPVPVGVIVWCFDLNGPFGDYMLMTLPFIVTLPIIGAGIAVVFWGRR